MSESFGCTSSRRFSSGHRRRCAAARCAAASSSRLRTGIAAPPGIGTVSRVTRQISGSSSLSRSDRFSGSARKGVLAMHSLFPIPMLPERLRDPAATRAQLSADVLTGLLERIADSDSSIGCDRRPHSAAAERNGRLRWASRAVVGAVGDKGCRSPLGAQLLFSGRRLLRNQIGESQPPFLKLCCCWYREANRI